MRCFDDKRGMASRFFPLQDERRLRVAFFLSALLHVIVLSYSKPFAAMAQKGGKEIVLTVILPTPTEAPRLPEPKDKPAPEAKKPIILRSPSRVLSQQAIKSPVDQGTPKPTAVVAGSPVISKGHGKVKALLVIDGSGRVKHIHWNQLPAMSDEELIKLEQGLRQKIYLPSGMEHTVIEEVE